MMDFTEEETEQYDRQIRLWGIESQKRLRQASVLVYGLRGLGTEVCKNIILTGVKSVTMMDSAELTETDQCSQFFTTKNMIGKNRAEVSQGKAQILNPMVDVKFVAGNPMNMPEKFFKEFDIIVATDCKLSLMLYLSTKCRQNNIRLFCADVFGSYGYIYSDLQCFAYLNDKFMEFNSRKFVKGVKFMNPCSSRNGCSKFATSNGSVSADRLNSVNQGLSKYKGLTKKQGLTKNQGLLRNFFNYPNFLIQVLINFRSVMGRSPDPHQENQDLKILRKMYNIPTENSKSTSSRDEELRMAFSQFSPVCAIVGGVIAQEVIKALSQTSIPKSNAFFFDPKNMSGKMINIG